VVVVAPNVARPRERSIAKISVKLLRSIIRKLTDRSPKLPRKSEGYSLAQPVPVSSLRDMMNGRVRSPCSKQVSDIASRAQYFV